MLNHSTVGAVHDKNKVARIFKIFVPLFSREYVYGVREGALRRKYMLLKKIYILFQKTYILFQKTYTFSKTYILFQKTYVFWNVYICGKTYIFRKAPSRALRVREGALQKNICFSCTSPEGTQIHVFVSVVLSCSAMHHWAAPS